MPIDPNDPFVGLITKVFGTGILGTFAYLLARLIRSMWLRDQKSSSDTTQSIETTKDQGAYIKELRENIEDLQTRLNTAHDRERQALDRERAALDREHNAIEQVRINLETERFTHQRLNDALQENQELTQRLAEVAQVVNPPAAAPIALPLDTTKNADTE